MLVAFTKMQGLGNDFVVINAMNAPVLLDAAQIRALADRRFGVGCDQVLWVEPPTDPSRAQFRYRIFNADGGEVEQCGNGARCFARFVHDQGLCDQRRIAVETLAGLIELVLEEDDQVTVNMGLPRFEPSEIPFRAAKRDALYPINISSDEQVSIGAVSMGNPHAVLRVDSVDTAEVTRLGATIESHPDFPRRVNVGFMQIINREHIRLRVFERGVGETLACGTGACAAVVIGRQQGLLDERVTVTLPGGQLVIKWSGNEQEPVWMTGPAQTVFTGEIEL